MKLSDVYRDNGKTVSLTPDAAKLTAHTIVTCNDRLHEKLNVMKRVANTESCVLISGEPGTNKQKYAEYIHRHSARRCRPYLRFDCAATAITQYEKVLFGEPREDTSGEKVQHGILENADGGTLLLDGCAFIPVSFYGRLRDVLEHKSFCYKDGGRRVKADVRILATCGRGELAALNKNIETTGIMRNQASVYISISSLRYRPEDIALLSLYFLQLTNNRCGLSKKMGSALFREILAYQWPGNERELQSFIEQAALISEGDILNDPQIIYATRSVSRPAASSFGREDSYLEHDERSLKEMVTEYELMLIHQSIRKYGSLRKAASALKIAPSALSRKLAAEKKKQKV